VFCSQTRRRGVWSNPTITEQRFERPRWRPPYAGKLDDVSSWVGLGGASSSTERFSYCCIPSVGVVQVIDSTTSITVLRQVLPYYSVLSLQCHASRSLARSHAVYSSFAHRVDSHVACTTSRQISSHRLTTGQSSSEWSSLSRLSIYRLTRNLEPAHKVGYSSSRLNTTHEPVCRQLAMNVESTVLYHGICGGFNNSVIIQTTKCLRSFELVIGLSLYDEIAHCDL